MNRRIKKYDIHHNFPFESAINVVGVFTELVNLMESVGESAVLLGGLHDPNL